MYDLIEETTHWPHVLIHFLYLCTYGCIFETGYTYISCNLILQSLRVDNLPKLLLKSLFCTNPNGECQHALLCFKCKHGIL